eukprot:4408810-Pyramimonas_sp.AAC.1
MGNPSGVDPGRLRTVLYSTCMLRNRKFRTENSVLVLKVGAERSPLFCANLWGDLHEFSDLLIATFGTDLGNRRNNVVWGHSRHWPPITAKLSFSRLCGRMWGIFGDDC